MTNLDLSSFAISTPRSGLDVVPSHARVLPGSIDVSKLNAEI